MLGLHDVESSGTVAVAECLKQECNLQHKRFGAGTSRSVPLIWPEI